MQTDARHPTPLSRRSKLAFSYAVPIGVLGGLIGLGGAEFRLPVLAGPLRYPARQAVPLNLAVSLVTLIASLAIRSRTLSLAPVSAFLPGVLALIAGAVVAAFFGAALASKLSDEKLERVILVLLVVIGVLLIIEGFLPSQLQAFLPNKMAWHISFGILFGLLIGLVSSLLGVAGGELIIPTLVFAFGADIKTAGTASLIVSLPTVIVGVARYAGRGAFAERQALSETVVPMGIGSVIGAVVGGILVGVLPASVLKVGLGVILMFSAFKTFRRVRSNHAKPALMAAIVLVSLFLFHGCASRDHDTNEREIIVAAAADLAPAFEELGKKYVQETGLKVTFSFGSTGTLAKQIENEAPFDLFAAANMSFVDDLEKEGLILPGTKASYARGRITIWTLADSPLQVTQLEDLGNLDFHYLAIANPEHAPYGTAAKEALQAVGVWDKVKSKVVSGENVPQAQQYAETGNAEVAFSALSLSVQSKGRWVLIPQELHRPLDQALAIVKGSTHEQEARQFAASSTGRTAVRLCASLDSSCRARSRSGKRENKPIWFCSVGDPLKLKEVTKCERLEERAALYCLLS